MSSKNEEDKPKVTQVPSVDRSTTEMVERQSYVKNSSFLSRDIEAQKGKSEFNTQTLKKIKQDGSQKKEHTPPISTFKVNKTESKNQVQEPILKEVPKKEQTVTKDVQIKPEKIPSVFVVNEPKSINNDNAKNPENAGLNKTQSDTNNAVKDVENDESNGVGDKIKKFEKVAEDAGTTGAGKLSRPGSVRGRNRPERSGSDVKDDIPPPTLPYKVEPEKNTATDPHLNNTEPFERQPSMVKNTSEKVIKKPEPQRIIKPEFKQLQSPVDATIRSPSLGAKISDQFPSQGTAFRNVSSPIGNETHREAHKFNDDVNTQNNFKSCKFKTKEKSYSVSKGSSYFTRGSEEIWLVKKKDIEEIEERVLDSFRRAGGNVSVRGECARPSSDSGQGATMGRSKRQMYARSESLDPQWAGARAHTLKRQTSVACTCGHDKKPRAKSAGAEAARPRSRSHGDDNAQAHVLDKYETLV